MKSLVFILSLWLAIVPAWADGVAVPGVPHAGQIGAEFSYPPVSGGAAYVGPGDLTLSATITHYWGWSCVKASYSGNAIDLVDAATGNTTGTRLQCSGGSLVALVSGSACATTAAGQTFVQGGACSPLATTCAVGCKVAGKWDQITNTACSGFECDLYQNTNTNRPTYTATGGAGGKPCETYVPSQTFGSAALSATVAQPVSIATVDSRTGGTTSLSTIFAIDSLTGIYHSATAGNVQLYAGNLSANVAATDNAFHALQAVFNGASSILAVDGSNTTVSPGTGGATGFVTGASGGGSYTGTLCEAMFFSAALSSGDTATLSSNQHTRFGF